MTTTPRPYRNRTWAKWPERLALLAVLAGATWLRLDGVDFGLPALNDPDEPLFMMTAFDMLRNGTSNPGWFGHPGTITLYCLALVIAAVGVVGMMTGRFDGADGFASAVFADPSIVFLPARLFIVVCGIACVFLTYLIGRRLWGPRPGLIAAAILAVNALHVEYSQVIRTDVQASMFMLLCVLASLSIYDHGRRRDYVLAGLLVGLACATKWPAAAIALGPVFVGLARRDYRMTGLLGMVTIGSLLAASPFLLIDHAAVMRDLTAEARPVHPGATGSGLFGNLMAYTTAPLLASFGTIGLVLAFAGSVGAAWRDRRWLFAVVPGFGLFAMLIASQHLIWTRWLVPLLPFFALSAAWAWDRAVRFVSPRGGLSAVVSVAALILLLAPMLGEARTMATERRNDTRQLGSAWIRAHVPSGSSIVVEHGALDLLDGPWTLRFPLGSAGCIDPREALSSKISARQVEHRRSGRAVVDLGHIDSEQVETCRADFIVLSHLSRYRADPANYRAPLQRYRQLVSGGTLVARIEPEPGESGGPEILIYRLRQP